MDMMREIIAERVADALRQFVSSGIITIAGHEQNEIVLNAIATDVAVLITTDKAKWRT